MTIADLAPVHDYLEDGVSLAFPVPFRFLDPQDIAASRSIAEMTLSLTYGVDYYVTGGATDAGGTLTLNATVAGAMLHIGRSTPREQNTDYQTNDSFPAETHEAALDKLMAIAQELDAGLTDITGRALMVPPPETVPPLPPASERAQGILGFDANGDPVILPSEELGSVAVVAQRREIIATAGQTSFQTNALYTVGYVSVYVNGVRLSEQEFTATDGSNVVLAEPCIAGDVVLLEGFLGSGTATDADILFDNGVVYPPGTVGAKLQQIIHIADYVRAADALDPLAVFNGLTLALADAAARNIREIHFDARSYAQPSANITLNNVTLVGAEIAKPPYMPGSFATVIEQTDQARPIFRLGKNVTLRGILMVNPALTDDAAQAAITAAGAVTPVQKRAALESVWAASSPLLIGQAGDAMSTINLIDICVPKCWYFMRVGNVPAFEVAGAINIVRPRIFSVARDFIGKSSADVCNVVDGVFSIGISPDEFVPPVSSPLRDYAVDWGAFLEVDSAASNYASFDGFNLDNTVIFGKKMACLATSGALAVSRWRSVAVDAVSHAIVINPSGRILQCSFEIDSYSYRYPAADPDPDAASRAVILIAASAASSLGFSRFSVMLKSDYSAGPVVSVGGDQTVIIDFDNLKAFDFGAKATSAVAAVIVSNSNATVRMPDADIRALVANLLHSGISVTAGRVESVGAKFAACKYSGAITGGTLLLDHPTSTATVTADIIRSGGTWDVRDPRWSKAAGSSGYPCFRAIGGVQTFNSATPTVKSYSVEDFDEHTDFAGNAFIVPFNGQYHFTANFFHDAAGVVAGDRWLFDICQNGTSQLRTSYIAVANYNSVQVGGLMQCVAGDSIDVRLWRASGTGSINIFADPSANNFSGRKV